MTNEKIQRGLSGELIKARIQRETTITVVALLFSIASMIGTVFYTFNKGRMDLVYVPDAKLDSPVLLEKVDVNKDPVRTDRYLRGIVRRFIGYYFLSPDNDPVFIRKAIGWLHANVHPRNRERFESFYRDFNEYVGSLKTVNERFYPINDFSSLRIRQSKERADVFFVEQPGTYRVENPSGTFQVTGQLKMTILIDLSVLSSVPTALGEHNITGALVDDAWFEWRKDPVSQELMTEPLFRIADPKAMEVAKKALDAQDEKAQQLGKEK